MPFPPKRRSRFPLQSLQEAGKGFSLQSLTVQNKKIMEAPKTLRRPSNWQDFESLCKKLWGEIWNCPEIQKNGRQGQEQSGVDVFGMPFSEKEYYGIQCKGKSEYNHSQFSEAEILDEISKAENFEPKLKKFYLTTTAQNDAKIQAFVRKINIERIAKKEFEVHVFGWESIVDLIDENKQTHDWYLKNQNYKTNKAVKLTFNKNSSDKISFQPRFKQSNITYVHKSQEQDPLYTNTLSAILGKQKRLQDIFQVSNTFEPKINKSFFGFEIVIENIGAEAIEEYKIFLEFDGEIQELKHKDDFGSGLLHIPSNNRNTFLWEDTKTGKIIPRKNILVGDDYIISDRICVKPSPNKSNIIVKWKLVSKDFKDNGELKIEIEPVISIKENTVFIEDHSKLGKVIGKIEDFIVSKDDDEQ